MAAGRSVGYAMSRESINLALILRQGDFSLNSAPHCSSTFGVTFGFVKSDGAFKRVTCFAVEPWFLRGIFYDLRKLNQRSTQIIERTSVFLGLSIAAQDFDHLAMQFDGLSQLWHVFRFFTYHL